ncbi:hypothetical protein [Streptomyces sp. NPDC048442]|uniref:hypothetical protein n=1 Tax=Streptomyces sp. NPDC048442 TaxID=3154823 RepID=UPI003430FC72
MAEPGDATPLIKGTTPVNTFPGSASLQPHTLAAHVQAECAVIAGWKVPSDWPRLLKAAADLYDWFWAVLNPIDPARIAPADKEDFRAIRARGMVLAAASDEAVRGAAGPDRELRALRHVQEFARKTRALAAVLETQRLHVPAIQHQEARRGPAPEAASSVPTTPGSGPYHYGIRSSCTSPHHRGIC